MMHVVIGQNYWGANEDLDAAKARFRREGGRLGNGYAILTFDDDTEFLGVDNVGRYMYKGNPPTEKVVPSRGKKPARRQAVRR